MRNKVGVTQNRMVVVSIHWALVQREREIKREMETERGTGTRRSKGIGKDRGRGRGSCKSSEIGTGK